MFKIILPAEINQVSTNADITPNDAVISKLLRVLLKQKTAPSISAPQCGIFKRFAVINVIKPIILINPIIIEKKLLCHYIESCATYPNKLFKTQRYAHVKIIADNITEPLVLGIPANTKYIDAKTIIKPEIMEAVYVQQAIDFMDNIDINSRVYRPNKIKPIIVESKPLRNSKIKIKKNDMILSIKYKKLSQYIADGWDIIN
jgi:hypothetical protein